MSEFILLAEHGTNNTYQIIEKDNSGASHLLCPPVVIDRLKKVEALKTEIASLRAQLAACQADLAQARVELGKFGERNVYALRERIKLAEENLAACQRERDEAQQRIRKYAAQSNVRGANVALHEKVERLEHERDELRAFVKTFDAWAQSPEYGGSLFDAMLAARDALAPAAAKE